jgi:cell division protein DivIC
VRRIAFNFIKNKYLLTLSAFLLWMLFLNDIDLVFVIQTRAELADLRDQVEHLREETDHARESLLDLNTNQESLEKFAREEYLMRKPLEEIFLIKEKKVE